MASLHENSVFRQAKHHTILHLAEEARDFSSFREKLAEQGVLVKLVLRDRQNVEYGKPTKHRAVSFTDLSDDAGFAGQDIDLSAHVLITKFGEPKQDWYLTPEYYEEWQEQKELFPTLAKADQEAAAQYVENNKQHVQLGRAQEIIDRPDQVPDEIDQFTYYDTLEKIGADLEGPGSDFGVYDIWTNQQANDLASSKLQLDKSINSRTMRTYERGARLGLFQEAREKKDLENGFKAQQISAKAHALQEDRKTMIYLASEKKKLDGLLAETKPDTPERNFVVEQIALLEMKARYAKFASELRSSEINAVFKAQGKALTASNVREFWLDFKSQAKRDWTEAFSGKAAAIRAYREMREDNKLIVAKTLKYAMTNIKPKEPMRFEAWLHQQEMTPHAVAALNGMERQRMSVEQREQQMEAYAAKSTELVDSKIEKDTQNSNKAEILPLVKDLSSEKLSDKNSAVFAADNLLAGFETSFTFQKKALSDEKVASIGQDVAGKLYGDRPFEMSINDIKFRITQEMHATNDHVHTNEHDHKYEYTEEDMRGHDEYLQNLKTLEEREIEEYNKNPHLFDYRESGLQHTGVSFGEYLEGRKKGDEYDPISRLDSLENLDLTDPVVLNKIDAEYAAVAGDIIEMHPLGSGSDDLDMEGHYEAVQGGFGDPEYQLQVIKKGREIQQEGKSPEVSLRIDDTLNKNTKQQGERIARDATNERLSENTENRNLVREKRQAAQLVKEQENRAKELKENKSHGKKPELKLTKPM